MVCKNIISFCFIEALDSKGILNTLLKSLIIHAALTQPEHLILIRWMGLETQWKTSWKHGHNFKCPRMQIFVNLRIDKATKTRGDKQLYLITHFTKQTLNLNYLMLTLNVMVQLLNYPKHFLNLNSRSVVAASCLAVHFRPKMALRLNAHITSE